MGRAGSALNRFALVIVAVIGIGVVAPITATAATAYFSRVTTAKLAFTEANEAWDMGQPKTVWCPLGAKVMSGGAYGSNHDVILYESMPVTSSAGRQGWRVIGSNVYGSPTSAITIFAQCIK